MSDITGLREFCYHCGKVTATNPVKVTAGFDYRCAVCDHTVDQDFDEDYFEDVNDVCRRYSDELTPIFRARNWALKRLGKARKRKVKP